MKILHFINSMGGGGAERQLCYLCTALEQTGVRATVALAVGGPNLPRLKRSGARIVHLNTGRGILSLASNVLRCIAREKPDIVQTWLSRMDILGGAAARALRCPFIVSERCNTANANLNRFPRLHALVVRYAAAVVANSEAGLMHWREIGGTGRLLACIRNIVPFDDIDAVAPGTAGAPSLAVDRQWVLYAGRFETAQKNIRTLLAACEEVARRDPAVGFIFAGDGPDRELISAFAARHPQQTIVAGYLAEPALWSVMKQARVVVSCSRFEGSPNVMLEALACGAKVVASDIAAHREIGVLSAGELVPVEEPAAFADGILASISEVALSTNVELRRTILRRNHSSSAIAMAYQAIYRQILGNN